MPAIKYADVRIVLEEWCNEDRKGEGQYLPSMLQVAVPLWMHRYRRLSHVERQKEIDRLNGDDFCARLEYVLHKGPHEGDSARAFNDLAKAVALLSFCPGGVRIFGTRYQWKDSEGKAV